jgi:hypothetical protein
MSELLTLGRVRLVGDPADSATGTTQPKRIALLAYLALAGRTPVRRDALLALFWPELGEEEGRRALRQAFTTGASIGDDVLPRPATSSSCGMEHSAATLPFDQLVDSGKPAEALDVYRGDFFTGSWTTCRGVRGVGGPSTRPTSAARGGRGVVHGELGPRAERRAGVELGRRACELEPDQEAGWRRLMTLHRGLGDRGGARAYGELTARLEREFDAKPARETTALAERIRASTGPAVASDPPMPRDDRELTPVGAAEPAVAVPSVVQPTRRPRVAMGLLAAGFLLASIGLYALRGASRRTRRRR